MEDTAFQNSVSGGKIRDLEEVLEKVANGEISLDGTTTEESTSPDSMVDDEGVGLPAGVREAPLGVTE